MASQSHELHFVLFPYMAQGHMIPMFDVAKMLAQHGVFVTVITTRLNAKRFATPMARATESGLKMQFVELEFPCEAAGLLKESESVDMLPSLGLAYEFFIEANMLREPVERLFEGLTPRPSCIISDTCLPYTGSIATKFGIPRISFDGLSCFTLLCLYSIETSQIVESLDSDSEYFVVPGLPDRIEVTKNQLPGATMDHGNDIYARVIEVEKQRYGFIVNSFEELEPAYIQGHKKAVGSKVWCIGPVSLCNKNKEEKIQRGNKSAIDESECFNWLDSQRTRSVIYVSFGSICNLIASQLIELALGLEASEKPFIWVIRGGDKYKELEDWLGASGFTERTKGRGLIIRGWAPQVAILSDTAVGGFLTHCGWNSTLEGISAGKPLITWPLFGDQFLNEKLVVEVLKIGVGVGADATIKWGEEEKTGVLVRKEQVKNAIDRLMNDGDESEDRRRSVQELSKMAKKAVEKEGSSYLNMKLLIEDIRQQQAMAAEKTE